jgi:hypothetical protein
MTPTLHTVPVHRPIATGAPDEPRRLCRTCRVDWPCEGARLAGDKEGER